MLLRRNLPFLFVFFCLAMAASRSSAVTLTDGRGMTHEITTAPQRVMTTFLAADEIVVEMLVRAGDGAHMRLKAISETADDPALSHINQSELPPKQRVPFRVGNNLESILSHKPDLAFVASYNRPEIIRRLDQAGVKAFMLSNFETLQNVKDNIKTIGTALFTARAADQMISDIDFVVKKMKTPVDGKKKSVITYFPDGTVHGSKTMFDAIATAANAVNAAADQQGWPRLSAEKLASMKPDYIVAAGDPKDKEAIVARVRATPGFKSMPAATIGNVIVIPEKDLSSVSQHVIHAIQALNKALYP